MERVCRVVILLVITIRTFGSLVGEPHWNRRGKGVRPSAASFICPGRQSRVRRGANLRSLFMAKTSDVAAAAAVPSSADIERAAEFAREPFLLDGEGPEALAPGTARRHALDASLAELDAGA